MRLRDISVDERIIMERIRIDMKEVHYPFDKYVAHMRITSVKNKDEIFYALRQLIGTGFVKVVEKSEYALTWKGYSEDTIEQYLELEMLATQRSEKMDKDLN